MTERKEDFLRLEQTICGARFKFKPVQDGVVVYQLIRGRWKRIGTSYDGLNLRECPPGAGILVVRATNLIGDWHFSQLMERFQEEIAMQKQEPARKPPKKRRGLRKKPKR